ncbi:MarR family transcriptional regulator [Streptomyces sp. TRM68367]|uniref:MarR family transcriptional regulator n=1 Tax=Streptomyces sp. TRM68367 TaxID=2758415 RepID=UPI00165BEEF4|nr:MarR family transcriptional regulator [Streptomyces sp. TRM68367]MBC9728078.1 MarR family transcriptional regulator [Streptomyces sp. TRM68367]
MLVLVEPLAADSSAPVPVPKQETEARDDADTVLLAELRAGGPRTQTGLAKASGVAKATTARALARLVKAGKVAEVEGGRYAAAEDEASSC